MARGAVKAVPRRTLEGLMTHVFGKCTRWENMTTVLGSQAWSKFGSTDAPEVDEYPFLAVPERIQFGLGRHHVELRRDSDPNALHVHGPSWAHCVRGT